jgi:hypothetical protein
MSTSDARQSEYLSCAETAKLLRGALKAAFPGVRFSVRSHTYSMGASIQVEWTDGPRRKDVEIVTRQYEGSDFDGMVDLKTSRSHWLLPDGRVVLREAEGSVSYPAETGPEFAEIPGARPVTFAADYVFANRRLSPELQGRCEDLVRRRARRHPQDPNLRGSVAMGIDGRWVESSLDGLAYLLAESDEGVA